MTTLQKFQEVANINFVEYNGDIEISELNTADGYELFYITQDIRNLQFDSEVYYYKPDFDTIMAAIDDYRRVEDTANVACYFIDEYFDEYDMLNWLESEMDEDEFKKFTDE